MVFKQKVILCFSLIFLIILVDVPVLGRGPGLVEVSVLKPQSVRQFEKGIEHYNAGRYYSALDIFRKLTGLSPARNSRLTASYLMTMKSYFHVGNLPEAVKTGQEFLQKFPTSRYRGEIDECFGDVFVTKGRYSAAVRSYLNARTSLENDVKTDRLDQKLKHLSNGLLTVGEIEDLLVFEKNLQNRTILTLMLGNAHIVMGKMDAAVFTLFRMDSELLPLSFRESYENLRKRSLLDPSETVVIGVILPLTGYDETMGKALLRGIQAAVEFLQERSSKTIVLEVMDNGGDILRTISNIHVLSSNPNLVAIIGPLSVVNAVTAATSVRHLGVPLLVPMSSQVGLSMVSNNIFQMTADLHKQGRYAAEYAVSYLGLKTVAVIAPADRLGKELSDGFVQRADELGGEVVAIEWYSGIPVDLSKQLNSLRKAAFQLVSLQLDTTGQNLQIDTSDNTFFISEADFFSETFLSENKTTAEDSSEVILSTVEGVYLPIHQGDINYVASQFSAYNLDTQLLGNTNWYRPNELGQEIISPNVNGMVVLADHVYYSDREIGSYPEPEDLQVNDRNEYKVVISGYDILTFLAGQLGDNPSRITLLENLSHAGSFRGAGKIFSFSDVTARVNSSLFILEYRNNRFIKVGEINSDSLLTHKIQSP